MGGGIESMAITEAFGGKTDGFVLSFFFFSFSFLPFPLASVSVLGSGSSGLELAAVSYKAGCADDTCGLAHPWPSEENLTFKCFLMQSFELGRHSSHTHFVVSKTFLRHLSGPSESDH